jgi:hypothetical protein
MTLPFWPFKKRPTKTAQELIAEQPPAPCGYQFSHWYWQRQGMSCQACMANEERAAKLSEQAEQEQRLVHLISEAVVDRLLAQTTLQPRAKTAGE